MAFRLITPSYNSRMPIFAYIIVILGTVFLIGANFFNKKRLEGRLIVLFEILVGYS